MSEKREDSARSVVAGSDVLHPLPAVPPKLFRRVAVSVGLFMLAQYAVCIFVLVFATTTLNNRFAEVALNDHMDYLVLRNVNILKGYLVVGLFHALLIYPVLRWWLRGRQAGRWAVAWRCWALILAILVFQYLRVLQMQPCFLGSLECNRFYYAFLDTLPGWGKNLFIVGMFAVLPALVPAAALLWYLTRLTTYLPVASRRWATLGTAGALALGAFFLYMPHRVVPNVGGGPSVGGAGDASSRDGKPLNVIIIASDSLRADHLSCNGYPRKTSPNIDQLAGQSVNFTQCMTPIASTLESMSSLMTGQYPHTHGLRHMFPNRAQVEQALQSPALPDILRRNGYRTSVVGDWCGAIFHVVPYGFEDIMVSDFDNFKIYMTESVYLAHFIVPLYLDNRLGHFLFPEMQSFVSYLSPKIVTDRVIDRLDRFSADEAPFFMTVFYSCTHLPYSPPYPNYEKWTDPGYNGPNRTFLHFDVDHFINSVDPDKTLEEMTREEIRHVIDLYDGCVTTFDDCVGRIVDHLEQAGLLDNTIVIVTSDHGDDLFEPNTTLGHGLSFNGGDQTSHIPMVMHVPGAALRGKTVGRITRMIDVAPTLLELLGLPADERMDGVSLKPYIDGASDDLSLAFYGETSYLFFRRKIPGEETRAIPPMDETAFVDSSFNYHFVLHDKYQDLVIETKERALRTERFKLVYTPGEHYPIHRLYDLQNDPHCERDAKDAYPAVFASMKKHLWNWIDHRQEATLAEINRDARE